MMLDEVLSVLSMWASMNSWLTPTVLFIILNLMIFTIAIISGFSHKPPPTDLHLHQPPPPLQPQLSRSLSILNRLKSLNLYNYTPDTHILHHPPPTTSDIPETHVEALPAEIEYPEEAEGPTMEEIYSRIIQSKTNNNSAHYGRQNSDTEPAGGDIPVRLPRKMKKSASDKSAFNHFEAVEEVSKVAPPPLTVPEERENTSAEEVDARADDFINKFKQQLKMQRMDSIQRYKEMIANVSAN